MGRTETREAQAAGVLQVALPAHLGDTVLALPALRLLQDSLDQWTLQPVGGPPTVDDLLRDQGLGEAPHRSFRRDFRGAAVLLAPSLRVAVSALRARLPVRIGLPSDHRRLLLTHAVQGPLEALPGRRLRQLGPGEHQGDAYLRIARHAVTVLGGRGALGNCPGFILSPGTAAGGRLAWEQAGCPDVLLHPWAEGLATKRWPVTNWISLGRGVLDEGRGVAVTCGPGQADRAFAEAVARGLGASPSLGPHCLAPSTWAAVAGLSRCVVLPDTGTAHLAAAVGARVVTLFGPTDPKRHAALPSIALAGGDVRDCWPCYSSRCRVGLQPSCTASIEPAVVLSAVDRALRGAA